MTTSDARSQTFAVTRVFLCIATLASGGWIAYKHAFTGKSDTDDEGYLLLSLLNYLKHHGLYTSTFAQYGPFYFYAQQTMHGILHLPVNHDGARSLMLLYWLLSSLLSFCFVIRLTRSILLATGCFLLTLLTSSVLVFEPGHPQEIILFLTQSALVLSQFTQTRWSAYAWAGIGIISAFISLAKINIGIFFIFAILMSSIALLPPGRSRKACFLTASTAAIVMPVALMHTYLDTWASHYCLLALGCIAVLCLTSEGVQVEDPISSRQLILLFAGGITGAAAILLIAIGQGMSLRSLLNGTILLPLRHPSIFYVVFRVPRGRLFLAGLLLLTTSCIWTFRGYLRSNPPLLSIIKVAIALAALVTLWRNFPLAILIVLPLLPILYLDVSERRRPLEWMLPRLLLSFVVGFGFLQAYPVAGSQVRIALTPGVAWACLLFFDGASSVEGILSDDRRHPMLSLASRHSSVFLLVLQTVLLVLVLHSPLNIRNMGPLLDLPGARHVHVSDDEVLLYRTLSIEIRQNCDTLFTMPGMGSLNLWSERPTPNGYNLSAWMTAFTPEEQQQIVEILRRTERPCVVYNPRLVLLWMPGGTARLSFSPLAKYVFNETRAISVVSDYQLRVPLEPNEVPGGKPSGI